MLCSYLLKSLTCTIVTLHKHGKSHLKHWSGPISHLKKWENFCGTNNFDGASRKENVRLLVHWPPQFSRSFFFTLWVETLLNPFGRPGILVTTASKHGIQGGDSKYDLCMNILYRNLGHFTAQNKNCHLMQPWSHGGGRLKGLLIQGK